VRINSNNSIGTNPVFVTQTHKLFTTLPVIPQGPAAPNPSQKTGIVAGFSQKYVVQSGGVLTKMLDQSGNGYDATFGSGHEASYVANYLNGQAAVKMSATTFATFAAGINLFTVGSPLGIYLVLQNAVEAGTYYHCFLNLSTPVTNADFSIVYSNDPNYNFFFGVIPPVGLATPVVQISGANITTNAVSLIFDYNGGSGVAAGSYAVYLNNASQSVAPTIGGANILTNGNYLNSLATSAPPEFPCTNSYLMECWIYNSQITSTERATIFKPYTVTTYGIAQS
jgi:hypothetical protein